MKNNLIGVLVGIVCAVVMIGSVMVPSINESTVTHTTFDNTEYSYWDMKELETGDKWTYSDSTWYYNDTELEDLGTTYTWKKSLVMTDTLVFIQTGQTRGTTYAANNSSSAEVVVVNNADALYVDEYANVSYSKGYGATPDGDYVMKTYDDSAYVLGDTPLWVTGVTSFNGSIAATICMVTVSGTINDGVTVNVVPYVYGTVTDIEVSNIQIVCEEVEGYENLYTLTKVTFDVSGTYDGGTVTGSWEYYTFVIPKEISAELSQHMSESEITLIGIIPLFTILAVLCAVTYAIMRNRD